MSQIKIVSFKLFISILFLLCYSGCSDKNKQPTVGTINHSLNWLNEHGSLYLSYKIVCTNCHGSDCNGGSADLGCFPTSFKGLSCHEQHPTGWAEAASHGRSAKLSPDTTDYGFSHCQKCHGNGFLGGMVNVSCFTCHGVSAPHPRAPWTDKATVPWYDSLQSQYSHYKNLNKGDSTLSICYGCHKNGRYSNKTIKPDTTLAAGTVLGCKNNTICHPK